MAFLVEDGTGEVAGANSYVSVAEFKAYWDDRGFVYTSFTDPQIEQALVKATDYIELRFRNYFRGHRLVTDPPQPLSFPRACLVVRCLLVEGIPDQLKKATHEYGKRALELGDLAPDPAGYDNTGAVLTVRERKIGPIEEKATYESGSSASLRPYPAADSLLEEFVAGAGGVIRA